MRILYGSLAKYPTRMAHGRQIFEMCNAFAQLGHEVTLLAYTQDPDADPRRIFSHYGFKQNFRLFLERPDRHRRLPLRIWNTARQVLAECDLMYTRHLPSLVPFMLVGSKPFMLESHALPWVLQHDLSAAINRTAYGVLMKREAFRGLVAISDQLKNDYLATYDSLTTDEILVAHDGYRESSSLKLNCGSGTGCGQGGFAGCAGYVGHLYPGKGMELIERLSAVTEWHFHVVGGTDEDLQFWSRRLRSRDNVVFHGFVAPPDLEALYPQFHVVLAPYGRTVSVTSAGEGDISRWISPLKLFEYFGRGLPVIVSDLAPLREVVSHGSNGFLADPDSLPDWVSILDRLRTDHELRQRVGSAARESALREHTWTRRAKRIIAFAERQLP